MNEPDKFCPVWRARTALFELRHARDALRNAAMGLPVQDHRIERAADIVHRCVALISTAPVSGSTSTSQTAAP